MRSRPRSRCPPGRQQAISNKSEIGRGRRQPARTKNNEARRTRVLRAFFFDAPPRRPTRIGFGGTSCFTGGLIRRRRTERSVPCSFCTGKCSESRLRRLDRSFVRGHRSGRGGVGMAVRVSGREICRDPRYGPPSRYHLHESVLQKAVAPRGPAGGPGETGGSAYDAALVCGSSTRGRVRHSDRAGTAWAQGCQHDDHLPACDAARGSGGTESGRSLVIVEGRGAVDYASASRVSIQLRAGSGVFVTTRWRLRAGCRAYSCCGTSWQAAGRFRGVSFARIHRERRARLARIQDIYGARPDGPRRGRRGLRPTIRYAS
jgi:hypothetical protein